MQRPSQVALNIGYSPPESPTRTSSDFEQVGYPPSHWSSQHEEELPLHYMSEETARRRVRPGGTTGAENSKKVESNFDDGKDVYNKMRTIRGPTLGGRPQKPPPPPATNLVSILIWAGIFKPRFLMQDAYILLDGVYSAEFGSYSSCYIHLTIMLDAFLSHRKVKYRRMGWSTFWKVRFTLS